MSAILRILKFKGGLLSASPSGLRPSLGPLSILLVLLCSFAGWAQALAGDCQQFLLVVTPGWNQPKAQLQRYEKKAEKWLAVGAPMPAILGRAGLGWGLGDWTVSRQGPQKKEGDNRAPAGSYQITQLWLRQGIAGPPPGGFPVHRIQADTVAVDDPKSAYYNRILRSSQVRQPDWESWEKMDIPDYDRVLVVSHNLEQPTPGRGSCIFIHRWEGLDKPTSGCTALAEKDLIEVIGWLRPQSKPRLVQLPKEKAEEWLRRQTISGNP
ncbi:MAG: L,D-transpeptidase family protein [Candidatus Eremiobacteraeota bacterium]|nr:L,D-transpeptidase family protein [Candidatus Eremiobacteraeota bacterium]MCW5872343.1 L,D-transpeptidase family protein [Candidatus Eremiobacteraeota bacterium]